MNTHTTSRYALVSGTYWMANVFMVGYANVAMGLRGLDSFQVGIAFSGGAVMAILFQLLSAFFMDRYRAASVKRTIAVIAGITMLVTVMLDKGKLSAGMILALYMIVLGAEMSLDSVIYTMAMEIMNYGGHLNFGFCRGMGSIGYAVIMTISGYLLQWIGYERLLLVFLVFQMIFIVSVLRMENPREGRLPVGGTAAGKDTASAKTGVPVRDQEAAFSKERAAEKERSYSSKGYVAFLNENRMVLVMLVGIAMISMCGNIIENFQIDILRELGSDERMMGISRGLSAAIEFPVMCSFLYLRKKLPVGRILILAMVIYCVRSGIYAFTNSVSGVLLAQGVQGIAFALYNLSSTCFINESIPKEDVAKGQAVIGMAIRGAGGILANSLGGYLIARYSAHDALYLCLVLTLAGGLIISGAALYSGRRAAAA